MTKNRWCQFSFRTLLVAVSLLGIFVGLVARQVHREQKAIAAILEKGGTIEYAHQWNMINNKFLLMRTIVPDAQPPGPTWLRNLVGDKYFVDVVSIDLTGAPITDDDLKFVQEFESLLSLSLNDTNVSDEGLAHLRSLKQLDSLTLRRTKITRKSIAVLKEMTGLRWLDIHETQLAAGHDYSSRIASLNATRDELPHAWIP